MMMIQRFFALVALLTLAACGGGGGASGTSTFGSGSGTGSGGGTGGGGGGGTTTTAGLTLSISNATITPTTPATVTVNLRDNEGKPLSGRVISISTARAGLASLSASSVLTGTDGTAQVTLRAGAAGTVGADDVTAVANVGTTTTPATVTASIGFNVAGAAATIATTITSTTLKASTGAATLTATVRDERGAALPNQVVLFSASATTVTLGAASALTDAQGRASTTVAAANAASSAAVTVLASTTVNGNDLQSGVNLQVVAEQPSMTLTLSSSAINTTTPATVRALLRDVAGNPIANAVVSFTSQFALGNFDNANGVTDANGTAQAVLSPKTATTTGSDVVTASATVTGAIASARATVQFAASSSSGVPVLQLALSTTSISAAAPATVTATLTDSRGSAVAGQVVTFSVVRGLARTNIATSLTDTSGRAVVVLSPTAATSAGADEVTASASVGGAALQATRGFQVQATAVTLDSFAPAEPGPLSAYGQTTLTLRLTGASVTSPVNITLTSSCVSQGKATLSPSTFSATSNVVTMQYRDAGCGAVQVSDQLQAVVTATGTSLTLTLPINAPGGSSIAFVQASPEQIFLRGSGFTESSLVTFEARDAAGNALPAQDIELRLQTGAGGVLMEGRGVESVNPPSATPVVLRTNALGRVSARVNSGTLPTPVRVHARFRTQPNISTVSSNLSVAVGLPSQLNFSLSQGTKNIEGFNIDGTPNTYQIIAADRNGNPVPVGTSINFVAEGGQVEAIKQTQLVNGISRTVANFVSSSPKPVDGRITVVAYALGEESFVDLNGNNTYDPTEPFQDLGNIFKDRNFDGFFDARDEEFISLEINNAASCAAPNSDLLGLNASIPSMPSSCDGRWSGAGQVYVRRAAETVLSTSAARPLWADTSRLGSSNANSVACRPMRLQWGPQPQDTFVQAYVSGQDVWYGGSTGVLTFFVTDANPGREKPFAEWTGRTPGGAVFLDLLVDYERFPRFNPMAAGTVISATSLSVGLSVLVAGGSPVADSLEPTIGAIGFTFTDPAVQSGSVAISFRSPSGLSTTYQVSILRSETPPTTCTLPP